jgi:hypothetical protein
MITELQKRHKLSIKLPKQLEWNPDRSQTTLYLKNYYIRGKQ